jgi:hypothetical protein
MSLDSYDSSIDRTGEKIGFVYVSRFVQLRSCNCTKREIEKGKFSLFGSGHPGLG